MNKNRPWSWAWTQSQIARSEALEEGVQEIDNEYLKLLQVRQSVLAEIESIEQRVRLMIRSCLSSELPK
jgi:hypothetical protein